jgi:phosphoribosylglycinamide formyltransferase 1
MNVAVLASGNGSNLQALLEAEACGALAPAHIVAVASNVSTAPALARAVAAKVATIVIQHQEFATREAFDRALYDELSQHKPELIVLAGFMRILSPWFCQQFPMRIINTHPSLLPAFPGKDAPAQALAYGVKITGVSIHFVDASLDGGPVIAQRAVAVEDHDTAESLHRRIQQMEHQLLPEIVNAIAMDAVTISGRTVSRRARMSH